MKDNPVAKNAHKFNKSQVMKDRKKAMKKGEVKHKGKMDEKLSASDDAGEWVKDFRKSDAPQFKGKTDKEKQRMAIAAYLDAKRGAKNEDLRKWFGKGKEGDWVRVGTDGEIKGDCAREPGEGKPKCMPRSKAHSMDKDDRASAARRKRRADPDTDRPGTGNKPIMVKTKKEALELEEKNVPNNPKLWAKFKAQAKAKFDVYPSAYANGWAAKQYKAAGGTWKTVKEEVEQMEGKNTPGDGNPCWDTHKKVGTKMKNGKRVNDCVPKNESMQIGEKQVEEGSAQDRLNKRAAKLGIGNRNKAADDYMARMKAKHGEKGVADRLASNQAKIDAIKKARMKKEDNKEDNLDELSTKTLSSYINKASDARGHRKLPLRKVDNRYTGVHRASQKLAKREDVNEELTPVQKRKYMNLKKRAKAGNSQAKIRLKSFEKEFAKDIEMSKTSSKSVKTGGKVGAADPTTGQFGSGGSGQGDDMNLIVQLRKAQDLNGKEPVKLKGNKSVTIPKSLIDKILAKYDTIQKPQDKKKFELLVTKELRKKAK